MGGQPKLASWKHQVPTEAAGQDLNNVPLLLQQGSLSSYMFPVQYSATGLLFSNLC